MVIVLLAIIAPKTYDVSRSILINSSKKKVFDNIKFLKKQQEWSPWANKDPNMINTFTGTDGEVGFVSYWKGNKEVGEGEQEIAKIVEGESVEGQLHFLKPFKSTSNSYLILTEKAIDETEVVWGFKGKNRFPMSVMMLFMNMDTMVGKDFEAGLRNLKVIMEE
ncbi:polyketide cyclase [Arenibacter certesii]|uniref:Polyketide cyclase n=1 Tax=Arenibacter certesii TaxID=228955 RepID=A0A918J1C2_9FLAO|nr:polyketide cyclase [Arenibacter certesii]